MHSMSLRRALWLAVILGLIVQSLIIMARLPFDGLPSSARLVADILGGVSWSVIVCGALTVSLSLDQAPQKSKIAAFGMVGAPLGFFVSKAFQRTVEWVQSLPVETFGSVTLLVAVIKSIEYGFLGYVLSKLVSDTKATIKNHLLLGALTACIFGTLIVAIRFLTVVGSLAPGKAVGIVTNELLFPIGCSVVIGVVRRVTPTMRQNSLI